MRLPILLLSILGLSLGFWHDLYSTSSSPPRPPLDEYATSTISLLDQYAWQNAEQFFTKFIKTVKSGNVRELEDSLLWTIYHDLSAEKMISEFHDYPYIKINDARLSGDQIETNVLFLQQPSGHDIKYKLTGFILSKNLAGHYLMTSIDKTIHHGVKG
ncbi:DUF3828 domain-containing protein [Caenorhabditis elegans]|uniref:DUF3828 domain-containing protein n=1 Tax=Caenorhabditis elegans TaxID=6239 RepID=P91047_CAEEL|nr:DUF3828 domain-containing protein [Caenorhabditis elegans]CCD64699.1 DUF3828 domain-containing protein [Caenorhabditis elegans]|eukprot:NP_494553.1 Uncharacterized protein CELE_C16C8.9 [Caenorhabditis elegans]